MLSIRTDLRQLEALGERIATLGPSIQDEIQRQLQFIQATWLEAVQGRQLPGMTRSVHDEEYAASITEAGSLEYPFNEDPFWGRVLSTRPQIAWRIEDGYPSFDMKCIANGRARVYTRRGWRAIKTIRVGDFVMGHDMTFHRVASVMREPLPEGSEVLAIRVPRSPRPLLVTPNHPLLLDSGQWVRADRLTVGAKIRCLGQPCRACGQPAAWVREYCSRSCWTSHRNQTLARLGRHPMQSDQQRARQAVWSSHLVRRLIREGRHASVNRDIMGRVLATTRRLVAEGKHAFQQQETHHLAAVGLGRKARFTDPESKVAAALQGVPGWVRQYRFRRANGRLWFFDFAFPDLKLAIEINGERYHTLESDALRRTEVEAAGWTYLSFWSKQVYAALDEVSGEILRAAANHAEQYRAASIDVVAITRRRLGKYTCEKSRYNITVEDSGSFIVEGLVVHNSGLLAGPRAKQGKHGPYTTVPFTHGSAGSLGAKAPPMPPAVYAEAKTLGPGERLTGMGTLGVKTKPRVGPMLTPYTWKSSPFEGMVRAGRAGHASYLTFRRVSERSDPASWVHPGMPANPVMAAVRDYVEPIVQRALVERTRRALGLG